MKHIIALTKPELELLKRILADTTPNNYPGALALFHSLQTKVEAVTLLLPLYTIYPPPE